MRYPYLLLLFCVTFLPAHAQVSTQIKYEARNSGQEQQIFVSWSDAEEHEWKVAKKDLLEIMALRTGISSSSLPKSQSQTTAYSFVLQTPAIIEVLIEIGEITEGESLIIKDLNTGNIKYSSQANTKKKVLLPAFNPETTVLIWTTSKAALYQSRFTIKSLYLQEMPEDRGGPTIGFGTALSCPSGKRYLVI